MENKIIKRDEVQGVYFVEEVRAALVFEELMEQMGFTYNPHGDCSICAAQALCDSVCPIITLVDKRGHNASFYCALASEIRTGVDNGHYECKSKKTTDGGTIQPGDGADRVPVDPHGDVY